MSRTLKGLIALPVVLILVLALAGNAGAGEEPQVVRVTLKDSQIQLSQFVVVAGKTIKFIVANQGSLSHQIVIEPMFGAAAAPSDAAPIVGTNTSWEIPHTLAPGIYRIRCGIADHTEQGMVSALVAEVPRQSAPMSMEFVIPLLTLAVGSAYIIWDSVRPRITQATPSSD